MVEQADSENSRVERRRRSPVAALLTFLGVLQLYNIVAHHQSLVDLSASVKLLGAWWRYSLGEIFSFVHIDLPPLQREMLALCLIAGSAANAAFYRHRRAFLPIEFIRIARQGEGADYNAVIGFRERNLIVLFVYLSLMFILLGMIIVLLWHAPLWLQVYVGSSLVVMIVMSIFADVRGGRIWRFIATGLFVVSVPVIAIVLWVTLTASYWRQIFYACRYLLLLLVADLAARYLIDPSLNAIISVPMPPPN